MEINDHPAKQGIWRRALSDLREWAELWRFRIPSLLICAGFACFGALYSLDKQPKDINPLIVGTSAVMGVIGGGLILGCLAFAVLVARAPFRQRNEARDALIAKSGEQVDPMALHERYKAFLFKARSQLPRGMPMMTFVHSTDRESINRRNAQHEEARRAALLEYHEKFQTEVLTLLNRPENVAYREPFLSAAEDPKDVGQLNFVGLAVEQMADGVTDPKLPEETAS